MKFLIQKLGFPLMFVTSIILFRFNDYNPIAFYVIFSSTLLLSFLLELLVPYERQWNNKIDIKQDIFYAIITILISPISKVIATYVIANWGLSVYFLNFRANQTTWLQVIVGLIISGFFPYWYHRLSHTKNIFFWKIHSIHHSPEKIYWLNGFRFHPINALLNAFLSLIPLLLLGFSKEVIIIVGFINNYVSVLNHSNVDFKLGIFNYIFNMNEVHRWHHSKKIEEGNNNYSGGALIIWDLIFSTYYHPKRKINANELGLFEESKKTFPYQKMTKQICYPFCKSSIFTILLSFIFLTSFTIHNNSGTDGIVGKWLTGGKEPAKVEIFKSGENYFGKIIWLKEPNLNGKPKMDIHNPDNAKRNNAIIGLQILQNFKFDTENNAWVSGTIYDPKCGDTFKCIIRRQGNTLSVRGYIGISLFGKTETWTKSE